MALLKSSVGDAFWQFWQAVKWQMQFECCNGWKGNEMSCCGVGIVKIIIAYVKKIKVYYFFLIYLKCLVWKIKSGYYSAFIFAHLKAYPLNLIIHMQN